MINQDDIDDNIENRCDNNNPPVYLRSASTLKSSWKAVLQVGFDIKTPFWFRISVFSRPFSWRKPNKP